MSRVAPFEDFTEIQLDEVPDTSVTIPINGYHASTNTSLSESLQHRRPSPVGNEMAQKNHALGVSSSSLSLSTSEDLLPPPRAPPPTTKSWTRDGSKVFALLLSWYMCSSLSNNFAKAILTQLSFPLTLTIAQFAFISFFTWLFITVGRVEVDPVNVELIKRAFPVTAGNVVAHFLTSLSLNLVPVSFTHTIKATSPIFTVLVSMVFLRKRYEWPVLLSLVPIILGTTMCTFSEVSYNFVGFMAAFGSTLLFTVQNIYSKKLFKDFKIHHLTLLFTSSSLGMIIVFPAWLYYDFAALQSTTNYDPAHITFNFLAMGCMHFLQNLSAFTVLSVVSPLTYTIGSAGKRIFVIVSAVLWFGNAVQWINAAGIIISLSGVVAYNRARFNAARRITRLHTHKI